MYSPDSEALTQASASSIARKWVAKTVKKPIKPYAWSQMRWIMDELADRCIAESLRLGEDETRLCDRLDSAHDIIYWAWQTFAPDYATAWLSKKDLEICLKEQERAEKAIHTLWDRHDPKRAFNEGTRSEHYTGTIKGDLPFIIASYLSRPYLRHPMLDWIFLDMTISQEVSAYGEHLKKTWLPGKRDLVIGIHDRYLKAHGNLAEMTKIDWNEVSESFAMWFFWALVVPIGGIWASFHWEYTALGVWLRGIYAASIAGFLSVKILEFAIRFMRRLIGKVDPRTHAFGLWDQMYEVWRLLEGPVVNPTLVREAMVKSRDQGAVWNNVSWSLVDRVIAIDPAVWVVQPDRS